MIGAVEVEECLGRIRDEWLAVCSMMSWAEAEILHQAMGRAKTDRVTVAGTHARRPHKSGEYVREIWALRDLWHATTGRPWYRLRTSLTDGAVTVEVDADRPPEGELLRWARTPGTYIGDLELYPRPPELVPGWMKVELAAVGAWDLVADEPRWNSRREPTGTPQSPESVGIEPPPGAGYAILPPRE